MPDLLTGAEIVATTLDPPVAMVGFDGDDTLWHSESIFAATHERFRTLVERYEPRVDLDDRLLTTERRNLALFGYGVKGYALSLIETAIECTDQRMSAADIATIVGWAKDMLAHPVELLDGVAETIDRLAGGFRLALITKGDFFHQESKIARSGLAEHFERIEIVAEKEPASYRSILRRADVSPTAFLMVGNSLRSDVLPVLAIGGRAVHIPYHVTWEHERVADHEHDRHRYRRLGDIRDLPAFLGG